MSHTESANLVCIVCPRSCAIQVKGGAVVSKVCKRGKAFALQEIACPSRVITTTLWHKPASGEWVRIPVKTKALVPLADIPETMQKIHRISVTEKCRLGDEIVAEGLVLVVTGE